MTMHTDQPFWRSVFSEDDGSGSWSRVASALSLFVALVWVSFVVWHTKAIPSLEGISLFVATVSSGYAINKISTAISDVRTQQPAAAPKTEP